MATVEYTYCNPKVPRDPNKYRKDEHAVIKTWKRDIDGWLFDYLIENGRIDEKDNGRYLFRAELESIDPEEFGLRTDEWVMPIQLVPEEEYHIVTTSPYIMGIEDDELTAKINPIKPNY